MTHTVTVVGASLAGLSTARALRQQGFAGRLVIVGAEQLLLYDRLPLSKEFLAGEIGADELRLTDSADDTLDVEWRLGRTAVRLVPADRAVLLDDGQRLISDKVVVATGARARRPDRPERAGLHTVRTLRDAVGLRAELVAGAHLLVVGAGFIGAEIASTAVGLGLRVTMVERLALPFEPVLGPHMAEVVTELHRRNGVTLSTGVGVAEILGESAVRGVRLTDGREIAADLVVAGLGARANVEWLAGSGLHVNGGVCTDAGCATNIPQVLAVGDCASSYRRYTGTTARLEHWTNATQQPITAAATLLGRPSPGRPVDEVPYFWSDQYGSRLQFAGHWSIGDKVDIVEGSVASGRFLADYRRDGKSVAVFAMNMPRPFGRWRRELASRLS